MISRRTASRYWLAVSYSWRCTFIPPVIYYREVDFDRRVCPTERGTIILHKIQSETDGWRENSHISVPIPDIFLNCNSVWPCSSILDCVLCRDWETEKGLGTCEENKRETEKRQARSDKIEICGFVFLFLSSGFQPLQQESITPSCNLSINVCNHWLLI